MIKRKTKVVFVQLGSPKSLKTSDMRSYLRVFLSDRRVIDLNPYFWKIILYLFILPFRPKESGKKYARIFKNGEFPLMSITKAFAKKVKSYLTSESIEVEHAFLLSSPKISDIWDSWEKEPIETRATHLKIIPMFPQYSESTTVSGLDVLSKEIEKRVLVPNISVMTSFHNSKAFIENCVKNIDQYLTQFASEGHRIDKLMISFHGIQKRRVVQKNDPYYRQCYETFFLLKERISKISKVDIVMTFQSRFGSEEWLTPYTEPTAEKLIESGAKNIAIFSPSFVADCLETIDELGFELREIVEAKKGELFFIPSLNDNDLWCQDFAKFIETDILKSEKEKNEEYYYLDKADYREFEQMSKKELKMKSEPMSAESKKSIKLVFLTIFLDLLGFSIILPLFPTLASHYLTHDSENVFLKAIFGSIEYIANYTHGSNLFSGIVLFGGILGAIYSILQFIAAPMWGALSDKIGRRPVLLTSLIGMAISYLIWFFSGSFTLLIISRIIDGIMGGNISTATAVVSDVTNKSNRSKGMAFVGIAFALGFIFGPAIGGIASTIDLTKHYPELVKYGINPFSVPALVAFVLTCINVIQVYFNFKETNPPEKRGQNTSERSANPLKIFKPLPYKGVNAVNLSNFLFLSAFSGMEFTLTFLAHERLGYSSMDNAYIFIYIGFIIALIQGGVVRRKAHQVGEKKMALFGLVALIPGLIIISQTKVAATLYFGLFFLAIGSAMIIPCLSTLVTFYTPHNEQGRSIGIFRSMGALARVIGPLSASIVYYKYGSTVPYLLGAAFLILPILLVASLPKRTIEENDLEEVIA